MKRVVVSIAVLAAALSLFAAVKASHAAVAPVACGDSCDMSQRRVAMSGPMTMPQTGADASDMAMGPHMKLSPTRPMQSGDQARVNAVVATLRTTLAKFQDYRVAETDGYVQFLPNVNQPRYHFTNKSNAMAAERGFDATRPTSLLYEKDGDGFKLVGAMYTAPRASTPDQLDARLPLSIARWHQHVNICWGPPGTTKSQYLGPGAQFGLLGSISSQTACDAANGRFQPVLFNWMVHVYPYETDPAKMWRVDMAGSEQE